MSLRAIVIFDIDGVIRDVSQSYRRAIADTVEHFTDRAYRPTQEDIDQLKAEGRWNNDWDASQELIYRHFERQGKARSEMDLDYGVMVDFFQHQYRGADPVQMAGYICHEPLLVRAEYFDQLTAAGIAWGFFSGAMEAEARYALEGRLGLPLLSLVAMEDAPGKPDPTGLFAAVSHLTSDRTLPVLYAGDTVADLQTVQRAKALQPDRPWIGVGILPPHVQVSTQYRAPYQHQLEQAGAAIVLNQVEQLTPSVINQLASIS